MLFGVVNTGSQAAINRDEFIGSAVNCNVNDGREFKTTYPLPSVALGYSPSLKTRAYQSLLPVCSETGDCAVVFSGQIYNSQELHAIVGTEVQDAHNYTHLVLALYRKLGHSFVEKINGKFAFAIWDKEHGRIILGRDRLGIEPLYYFQDDNKLIFASAPAPIRRYLGTPREIYFPSLCKFLLFGYNPGFETFFTGINKLKPGHLLHIIGDRPAEYSRYWRLDYSDQLQAGEDAVAEELAAQLRRAVDRRISPDEISGVFVSGGMDSSCVLGLSAQRQQSRPFTFSYRCRGESYDESPFARHMAKSVNSIHDEIEYAPDDILLMSSAIKHMDEPFCDVGINIATYLLGRAASNSVDYVMTGDGGDELFAGHPVYEADKMARYIDAIPGFIKKPVLLLAGVLPDSDQKKNLTVKLKRFAESLNYPADLLSHRWRVYYQPAELGKLVGYEAYESTTRETDLYGDIRRANKESEGLDYISRSLYSDYHSVVDFYLRRNDINAGVGLETRYPLLDHELVEYCARIPVNMKIRGWFDNKYIFRKSMESILPHKIVHREDKLGHSIPLKNWMRDKPQVKEFILDHLSEDAVRKRGWFNLSYINQLTKDHMDKRRNNSHRLWTLAVLEMWMREHVDDGAR